MTTHSDEANCAWSDYRKDYGVSPFAPYRVQEHKAFHAGWDAAKGDSGDSQLKPPKKPGMVRYRVEIMPHDWANDGTAWESGTGDPKEVAQALRGYADWVEVAATSEAAVLARRRDELARELYETAYGEDAAFPNYENASESMKVAVDKVIAAEAEVARLKGEGR